VTVKGTETMTETGMRVTVTEMVTATVTVTGTVEEGLVGAAVGERREAGGEGGKGGPMRPGRERSQTAEMRERREKRVLSKRAPLPLTEIGMTGLKRTVGWTKRVETAHLGVREMQEQSPQAKGAPRGSERKH